MIESYPLYWPEGWKRTDPARRKAQPLFRKNFGGNRDELLTEIDRLGGRKIILSTNIPLRNDGLPYATFREPQDPGVAVYFDYRDRPMCFACDQYAHVTENVRAIALTIGALRGMERWGASDMMERAFRGFAAIEDQTFRSWREILGFKPGAPVAKNDIADAFRRRAQVHHPDKGGDPGKFRDLIAARDRAMAELGIDG